MKLGQECFTVRDGNGHALACVYFEEEPGRRAAAKLLTRDEARRIAANIAKLSELLRIDRGASARKLGAELDIKSTELDQYCPKCDGARDPLKPELAHQQKSRSSITRLRPEAARREVSVDRLIRDLLDIIVDDKLTTAILDD